MLIYLGLGFFWCIFVKIITMKKLIEVTNLIILDASGSMFGSTEDVQGGLKQLFTEIKADIAKDTKGKTKNSTIVVDFSDSHDKRVLVKDTDGSLLVDKIADDYKTRGNTALRDAIGFAFAQVPTSRKNVFVSIFTDGQENASIEYNTEAIKKLIEEKKKLGWVITFIGTTEQALHEAKSYGIPTGWIGLTTTSAANGTIGQSGVKGKMRSTYYDTLSSTGSTVTLDNLTQESLNSK